MFIKLFFLRCYDAYNYIMDHNRNPLRHIPDPVARLWIMTVLAWLWCIAFGISIGSVVFMGFSMLAHVALLIMVFFTASVFYDAERHHDSWLLKLRKIQHH